MKKLLIIIVSFAAAYMLCNAKGDIWEENVRKALYKLTTDSIPDFAKEEIDAKGIPYVFYTEQNNIEAGKQYNPTIVANYALNYFEQFIKKKKNEIDSIRFMHCVLWLQNNISHEAGGAFYRFKWQQPWYPSVGAPYTSGMTSGRAIEVFTNAFQLTHDSGFIHSAQNLVTGFYKPIQNGGFTYTNKPGWWYEEIADAKMQTPRILDGHIYATTGVYEYWLQTKNDSAKYIVQKGLIGLKENLRLYDAGNNRSYYDIYKKPADKKYHRILTDQMKQLWQISKEPLFLNYYKKWNGYYQTPYILRVLKEKNISGLVLFVLITALTASLLFLLMGFSSKR